MQTSKKNLIRYFLMSLILYPSVILINCLLSSCAVNTIDSQKDESMITVTGVIRLVGNEPFTHLVLTTDEGKVYLIKGNFEKELRHLQYQRITASGKEMQPTGGFKYSIDVQEYKIIEKQNR
jgi:hypothetical protein